MKLINSRFAFIILLLVSGLKPGISAAQDASKQAFNTAVDQVNCETIKFIHREAGRAEIANNLECLTFESILKSIPEDEANTTAKVAREIEAYKTKFTPGQPVDKQLDPVINYAYGRITAKKRKGNVDDFHTSLEKIKTEAVANAGGKAANNSSADNTTADNSNANTPAPEADNTDNSTDTAGNSLIAEDNNAPAPAKKTDWLGWISLLVSLGTLGYVIFTRGKQGGVSGGTNGPSGGNRSRGSSPATMDDLRDVENRLRKEINDSMEAKDEQIANITASTGYTEPETDFNEPENYTAPVSSNRPSAEPQPPAPTWENTEVDTEQEDPGYTADLPFIEESPRNSGPGVSFEDSSVTPPMTEEPPRSADAGFMRGNPGEAQPSAAGDMFETGENQPLRKTGGGIFDQGTGSAGMRNTGGGIPSGSRGTMSEAAPVEIMDEEEEPGEEPEWQAPAVPDEAPVVEDIERHDIEDRSSSEIMDSESDAPYMPKANEPALIEEEGEAMPKYHYAGAPSPDGSFTADSFTAEPGQDSIFEIETYDDVPDKAFFSLLPYGEVSEKVLSDPGRYLAPCCEFENSPEGKNAAFVSEEGILRRIGGNWVVHEKAKLRFE